MREEILVGIGAGANELNDMVVTSLIAVVILLVHVEVGVDCVLHFSEKIHLEL